MSIRGGKICIEFNLMYLNLQCCPNQGLGVLKCILRRNIATLQMVCGCLGDKFERGV